MPLAVNRTTLEIRPSANEPDHPVEDWVIDPDLSAVDGWSSRYWQINGDTITLMNEAARDAVDAAIESDRLTGLRGQAQVDLGRNRDERTLIIRGVALVVLDQINALRALHSLPALSRSAMITAVAAKISSMEADA